MVVVVTRDVPLRFRGFLASCMLEIAPGVYTAPRMTRGVRERVWTVLEEWHTALKKGSVVMTWRDKKAPGGQQVQVLGLPIKDLWETYDHILVRRQLSEEELGSLEKDLNPK